MTSTMSKFILETPFKPSGDQPQAIDQLIRGLKSNLSDQVLLGVTGSGKTFTAANVIASFGCPTLVICHNKTLAAQLAQEYREFFPRNAVEYFVSYYDYYQPEAYIPQRDQYIEKEAEINQEIDKLRLSTVASLISRNDTIVVASVSCIYNLGSPAEYERSCLKLESGVVPKTGTSPLGRQQILEELVKLFYTRSEYDFARSTFRVRGSNIDVNLAHVDYALRISFSDKGMISDLSKISPVTGSVLENVGSYVVYPAKHYITNRDVYETALAQIGTDLTNRVVELKKSGKLLEAHRLSERTRFDMEMIRGTGYCNGIENYSRYFDGRQSGEPPFTLLDYFGQTPGVNGQNSGSQERRNWLVIIDESHVTVPQLRGMYNGDQTRKEILIKYGFRLPSAVDNRPLRFNEFLQKIGQVIYTSATPNEWEINRASSVVGGIVEQLVRPTGLLDPEIEVRGVEGQIENLIKEIDLRASQKERVLVTTMTKRLAEELTNYLSEREIKVQYLHSDVKTLERTDVLDKLRLGQYDVIVGVNLLREGLDLPEVSLVAILDADKEGFLRSATSLIQTMGRAARHLHGKVIMYAESVTGSMRRAMDEVGRRRKIQEEYNRRHHVTPRSVIKPIRRRLIEKQAGSGGEKEMKASDFIMMKPSERRSCIGNLEEDMKRAAKNLDFESATIYRDMLRKFKKFLD